MSKWREKLTAKILEWRLIVIQNFATIVENYIVVSEKYRNYIAITYIYDCL